MGTLKINQSVLARNWDDGYTATTSAPGTGVTLIDEALSTRRMRLTLSDFSVAITAALDYGGTKLVDLPDKNILILGAEVDCTLTKGGTTNGLEAATDINVGIGTATASNATLSSTMQNIIEVTAYTANTITHEFEVHANDNSTSVMPIVLADGASNALFLNLAASITADDTMTASGIIDFFWIDLGNLSS